MTKILQSVNSLVWGIPTLLLILVAGVYLSWKTGFFQITYFGRSFRSFLSKLKPDCTDADGVSPYQALCTALAATVGTGNIAGVAGAISLGGPGAVFWMWICALLGMMLKCAEAVLAVHYRHKNLNGEVVGGPMYMIEKGMGSRWKPLAMIYAFFGVVAAFGVGNATQINAVLGGIHSAAKAFDMDIGRAGDLIIAALLAIVIVLMFSGGAKRIGRVAEMLVPFASVAYILLGIGVLVLSYHRIPEALESIFLGAFSPRAVTGGMVGSILMVCRIGAARGIFTNEAGMGTASIAHAAARVKHPVEQGMMGIMEVFLDTLVICTVTALVILCSGIPIPYGQDTGAELTSAAFSTVYGGWVSVLIALCLVCFAFATVLGWGFYGLRCAQYLLGQNVFRFFVVMQGFTTVLGALLKTGTVWLLAETVNGLMVIPNLIALLGLSPQLIYLVKDYKKANKIAYGGTYENLNQCKPVRTLSHAEISPAGSSRKKCRKNHLSLEHRSA